MPRSEREWAHRKLDSVANLLENCQAHLIEVYEVYNEPHPEIGEPLADFIETLKMLVETINQFKTGF